tara:strand:- start:135 stop:845 length:711 start_codon:yes stop_codon:yes gene_type:complete
VAFILILFAKDKHMPLDSTRPYTLTLKAAKESVSLTDRNSKMPGSAFSSDSFACKVGSKLAEIKGSICESCYARRIQKIRPSVNKGWVANYEKSVNLIATNPDKWVAACVFQINRFAQKTGEKYHRWFDSGDLDSIEQLAAICKVAEETPDIAHWLPTRELAIVRVYKGAIPSNLVIRLSAPMVDMKPVKGANTSTVHKDSTPVGHVCPAPTQGNNCGSCRACWTPSVANVSYKKH